VETALDDIGGPGAGCGAGSADGGASGPRLERADSGAEKGLPLGKRNRPRQRGGFGVEFEHLGEGEPRARYVREQRVIYVNLDHPQIRAAKGDGNIDRIDFRRLAYEVAFSEYAIALASELASNQEYLDPTDPIFDIRETMNRMAVRSVVLYTNDLE